MVPRPVPALSSLLAALLLGGCLAADPPDPKLDVPAAFRQSGERIPAPPVRQDWWRSFRSAELTRLTEAAAVDNLDIAAAVARIEQADARARIAGSALLPFVGATSDARRTRAGSADGSRVGDGFNRYGVGISASYEIDLWGRNRRALEASIAEASAAEALYDAQRLGIATEVARQYFLLRGLDAQEVVLREPDAGTEQ